MQPLTLTHKLRTNEANGDPGRVLGSQQNRAPPGSLSSPAKRYVIVHYADDTQEVRTLVHAVGCHRGCTLNPAPGAPRPSAVAPSTTPGGWVLWSGMLVVKTQARLCPSSPFSQDAARLWKLEPFLDFLHSGRGQLANQALCPQVQDIQVAVVKQQGKDVSKAKQGQVLLSQEPDDPARMRVKRRGTRLEGHCVSVALLPSFLETFDTIGTSWWSSGECSLTPLQVAQVRYSVREVRSPIP